MDNTLKYNDAVTELENILREMQAERVDIDRLAGLTRRAAELITFCRQKLVATEAELQNILSQLPKA